MSDSEHSTVTYTSMSSDDGSLYVGSPEEPPLPDFFPEPVYPEFMPPDDDLLLAKEQPLSASALPIAYSPGYITKSDPEDDPNEDDEDLEEDLADYPTYKDDEEEEKESFGDDADDEEEDEEEEHLAPADTFSPPAYRTTTRLSIRAQKPIPFPYEEEVDRLLAISTPPSSPLTSYSSPLPQIPSPPLPVSPPLPISPSPLPATPTHSN
ncbi:hypothetical protein Tco_0627069 [Tanacetum coccineum]|uniref:Uncharacterized protein n=1 Tax=Tanacetum coccineum TaxID=301880 RepID=A0ABQ4WLG2_9ASTR